MVDKSSDAIDVSRIWCDRFAQVSRAEKAEARCAELEARIQGSGWISVEERLPEKGQIVAFITHCPRDDYYDKRVFGGKYLGDGEFVTNGLGIQASHWMPLPEPPAIVGKKEG